MSPWAVPAQIPVHTPSTQYPAVVPIPVPSSAQPSPDPTQCCEHPAVIPVPASEAALGLFVGSLLCCVSSASISALGRDFIQWLSQIQPGTPLAVDSGILPEV